MGIISQNTTIIQETLENILRKIPIVLTDSDTRAYILVKDLSEEMEKFIQTGKADLTELSVFSEEYEQELIRQWRSNDYKYKYLNQSLLYMGRWVSIKYLQVSNPKTDVKISFIPWFMLPGRPFPSFVYVYAIWHYKISKQKSMRLSAMVAGEIFGIADFNKSTVSRNLKAMEHLFGDLQIESPLLINEPKIQSFKEIIDNISELLKNCSSIKMLAKACNIKTGSVPSPVNSAGAISFALSNIPVELSEVIKEKKSDKRETYKSRKRSSRQYGKKTEPIKRKPNFMSSLEKENTRLTVIAEFKAIVFDMAITYHRLLI